MSGRGDASCGGGGGGGGAGRGRRPPDGGAALRPPRTEEKPKSNLSADAKEWFPPNYVPPSQDAYYTDRANYYADSNDYASGYGYDEYATPNSQQFYREFEQPTYGTTRYSAQDRLRLHQHVEEPDIENSLTQLIEMLDEVTFNPGRFATLSGSLVDSFSATLDSLQHTQPLVDTIVNQAIKEKNFRYNAARLCTMFDSVETQSQTLNLFRPCLLERCSNEETSITSGTDTSSEYVCGFVMFLAELYMQFENPQGGRIKALGESLCNILKHMLSVPNDISTKAACQVLKLSGLALDADCKLLVDDIFLGLRASEAAGVQVLLVRNVINLRQNRWGSGGFAELVDSDSAAPTFRTQPLHQQNGLRHHTRPPATTRGNRYRGNGDGGGMFYLPEGHALTSEEAAFLNQHMPGDQHFSADGDIIDSDNDIWEPEMDEEQHADFLEFLRSSRQITR